MEGVGFSPEVVESVRYILTTDAWERFFVPSINNIKQSYLDLLIDPSQSRKDDHSDDYLRGCIATLVALLDLPEALTVAADVQAARREREQAQEDYFSHRADLGTP